jgi:hypothetical protein
MQVIDAKVELSKLNALLTKRIIPKGILLLITHLYINILGFSGKYLAGNANLNLAVFEHAAQGEQIARTASSTLE